MLRVTEYLEQIGQALAAENATEHTHRPALKALVESLAGGVRATNEPQRVRCGAPDFIVTRGETPLGYVETKNVGTSLDREEKSEQLGRYLEGLGNLVLTDYLEFRWYVNGTHRMTARLAKKSKGGKLRAEPGGAEQVEELLMAFLDARAATVTSAKELAVRMARIARLIRANIRRALAAEDPTDDKPDPLHDQLASFREVLLHDLTEEQFADMYAQTICYGLFAARCNARGGEPFTRYTASHQLPKTNPFLQKTFYHIAGPDLSPHVSWAVDDLVALLAHTNIGAILSDFGKRTRREDPVVHFYETFLAEYDPRLRETRGVYYTPEPVVSYIVRSVDHLLKSEFGLAEGLADASKITVRKPDGDERAEAHRVLVLDPATGTGTFLFGVINHIFETFRRSPGMWSAYVSEHLLPRLFGFELLMAPYAVAHLKLGLLLDETGYDFQRDERLRVYLTNTLEEAYDYVNALPFTRWIAEEANAASKVKQEFPVMVVLGNPPYSISSQNKGEWISELLSDYKQGLNERKLNLDDDFIKFTRFAQWRIEQTGYGIVAFITNHTYLDGITHRQMRRSLLESFDDIYVLDLHGNTKKKERSPDGSEDVNVFDIQQGVAISIFVRRRTSTGKKHANVYHAELWGLRDEYQKDSNGDKVLSGGKYHWLWTHDLSTTKWQKLTPAEGYFFFSPRDLSGQAEYERGFKITDWMPINSLGVETSRDSFAVDFDKDALKRRLSDLCSADSDEQIRERYELGDKRDWKLSSARLAIRKDVTRNERVVPYQYRPFDQRWTYYSGNLITWPRHSVLNHMLHPNLALVTVRNSRDNRTYMFYASRLVTDKSVISSLDNATVLPLYLYPLSSKTKLFDDEPTDAPGGRRPNLSDEFVADFAARLKMSFVADGRGDREKTFGPEDVFSYMYAVFHSPAYRSRYAEFLKIDFPRLPLTSDAELFRALCRAGDELTGLHLLELRPPPVADYPVDGSNEVEAVRYTAPGEGGSDVGRVWINREQYFAGVAPEVWNFHIGGYQVASKWLKDRKGRRLTFDDLSHYRRVVTALSETIRLMSEIDAAVEEHSGWPLK